MALLQYLLDNKVQLALISPDQIQAVAPLTVMTNKIRTLIKCNKAAIIQELRSRTINISPIEACYPKLLQAETCRWIIDAVRKAPPEEQKIWWVGLAQWLNAGPDLQWRCWVFKQLSDEWDRKQPRADFELAKAMFAGPGSKVFNPNIREGGL